MSLLDFIAGLFRPAGPAPDPAGTRDLAEVVRRVNDQRAIRGLALLRPDPRLDASARSWARAIAREALLTHGDAAARIGKAVPGNLGSAECIAEGQPTPAAVVAAWMNDAPHKAILLGDYTLLGVGVGHSAAVPFWVADFAKTTA